MRHDPDQPESSDEKRTFSAQKSMGQKYLGFRLDDEIFGFELLTVREIIRMTDVTPIPRSPAFIRGIINLRGKIIPVVDLRKKFCLPAHEDTDVTCIIVVDIGNTETGVVVDRVAQVLSFDSHEIEDSPSFSGKGDTDYIKGIGKRDNKVVVLLDVAKIMAADEIDELVNRVKGMQPKTGT
ncbi:chemotaxis protein CheW [Oligoflexus tunisiensis]|uniref:chemotaxis protein CheW n=1 Tax=Oligoflexus tunisiensis TaxID=708132 RepID=UPI000AAE0684|nr:chemotaxis protein CheW [Oligoflexus tunisiensis]